MHLNVTQQDGYYVAKIDGPLDDQAKGPFREHLHPLFARPGTRLILDMSGAPRINSAGIGNLVALTADANTNGCRVTFCSLSPFVSSVMSVTKLDRFFDIAPSLAEAAARTAAV
jgi:anti-anti-sigma factor